MASSWTKLEAVEMVGSGHIQDLLGRWSWWIRYQSRWEGWEGRGLSNKKGGSAPEEREEQGTEGATRTVFVLGRGPWAWQSGAQREVRAGDVNLSQLQTDGI